MRTLREYARWLAGLALTAVSISGLYFISYQYRPCRHLNSRRWRENASFAAMESEVKRSIRRGVWPHDTFAVLSYGNAGTVRFIVDHLQPDEQIDDCFKGHAADALRAITNQDPGTGGRAWLEWWRTNQTKTEVEWVRDGFAHHGIAVSTNGTPAQVVELLALLGKSGTSARNGAPPPYLFHNALRWLRDLGVRSFDFAQSNDVSRLSSEVQLGLKRYAMLGSAASDWGPDQRLWKRTRDQGRSAELDLVNDTLAPDVGLVLVGVLGVWLLAGAPTGRRTMPRGAPMERATVAAKAGGNGAERREGPPDDRMETT